MSALRDRPGVASRRKGGQATSKVVTGDIAVRLYQAALLLAVPLVWHLAGGQWVSEDVISSPAGVYGQLVSWFDTGEAVSALGATLTAVGRGLLLGVVFGMLVGLAVALAPSLDQLVRPLIAPLFALPKTALMPLFILWFGITPRQRVVFTAVVVFFFIFYSVYNGVKEVPHSMDNAVRMMGATRYKLATSLYIPASLGWLIAGLRIAVPYAFVATTTAEIVASPEGVGHLIRLSGDLFNTAGIFAGIILVSVPAVAAGTAVNVIENRTAPWRLQQAARP
ncbi:MAG: ABC transporter permease subunit [Actinobacteria bacterium]|nr:ABC transporter permease subunit [Actinomycetota bacterium]